MVDPLAGRIEHDVRVWPGDPVRFRVALDANRHTLDAHVKLDWSTSYLGRKQDFIHNYRRQIEGYWSDQYAIRIKFDHGGESKTYTVRPRVVLHEAPRADAHFVMRIQNTRHSVSYVETHASMDTFMQKLKRKITGSNETPASKNVCVLAPDDVKSSQDTLKMRIGIKTSHVNNAGWGYSDTVWKEAKRFFAAIERTVPCQDNSAEPTVPMALTGLAQAVGRTYRGAVQADLPLVPLVVTGHAARGEDKALAKQRAGRVIGEIATVLSGLGMAGITIQNKEKTNSSLAGAEVAIGDGFKQFRSGHEYPIAAHEFGHMLGLLDEYFPADHEQNAADAPRYIRYCEEHGLGRPEFDKNSLSIMSMGDRVKKCHYVPFMCAIDRILEDKKSAVARTAFGKSGDAKAAIMDELNFLDSAEITVD